MKLKNLYLVSMALLAGVLASCNDDIENFDNQLYINASIKTSTVLLKSTVPATEGQFQLSMAKPVDHDITASLKVDASLVSAYNEAYYDNAEMLPEGHYTLENEQVAIPAGTILSDMVSVKFSKLDELDRDKVYVLPVTVAQANISVLQSASTMYYILKGAALINTVPDLTKNSVFVTWNNPDVVNHMKQFTAECLVRFDKFGKLISSVMGIEGHFLLRVGDAGVPDNQLQIAASPNLTSADLAIPTGEWLHIAMTFNEGDITVFYNGKQVYAGHTNMSEVNWGQTQTNEGNGFWIGHSYNYDRWLEGNISEVRIWNKALTKDEINAKDHFYEVIPGSEGLVAYWKFDEGAGTSIHDYSGNENHATAVNALTWNAVELPAKAK